MNASSVVEPFITLVTESFVAVMFMVGGSLSVSVCVPTIVYSKSSPDINVNMYSVFALATNGFPVNRLSSISLNVPVISVAPGVVITYTAVPVPVKLVTLSDVISYPFIIVKLYVCAFLFVVPALEMVSVNVRVLLIKSLSVTVVVNRPVSNNCWAVRPIFINDWIVVTPLTIPA